MYTLDTCPHLGCKDCLYCGPLNACKRIGGTNLQFAKPWFASCPSGFHVPCNSFEPRHPEYADLKEWTNFDDFWKVYKGAWLPTGKNDVPFVINGDQSVRYYVPLKMFIDGTMIKNNKLLATHIQYYKRVHSAFGYKLVTEQIDGIELQNV